MKEYIGGVQHIKYRYESLKEFDKSKHSEELKSKGYIVCDMIEIKNKLEVTYVKQLSYNEEEVIL